ncbi:MAG: lipoprotein [Nitrosomonas sp.]|nr:lipoprotein [Nitrosomonas sp.]
MQFIVRLLSIFFIIIVFLLNSCGTKGPLYLPQDSPPPTKNEENNQ